MNLSTLHSSEEGSGLVYEHFSTANPTLDSNMPKTICLDRDEIKECPQASVDLNTGVVMVHCMCQLEWATGPRYLVKRYSRCVGEGVPG